MSVRPHPTKPGFYIIDFYPKGRAGKRERLPFKGTEIQARQAEMELRKELAAQPATVLPTLAQAAPFFLDEYKNDHMPLGTERTTRSMKIVLRFFGKFQFASITNAMVEQYKSMRLQTVKPTTCQKELVCLSSFIKWAADKRYCNPFKVKKFPNKLIKAPMPTILTPEEVQAIFDQLKPSKAGFFACLYYGGLRDAEARYLTAGNVDLSRGLMVVRGKGNKQRVVPVIDQLKVILEPLLKDKTGELFDLPTDLRSTVMWACKRAGITKPVTPHSFRHAFGVHSINSGIGLRHLQLVMGHSTSTTTETYTTLAGDMLIKEMGKFK